MTYNYIGRYNVYKAKGILQCTVGFLHKGIIAHHWLSTSTVSLYNCIICPAIHSQHCNHTFAIDRRIIYTRSYNRTHLSTSPACLVRLFSVSALGPALRVSRSTVLSSARLSSPLAAQTSQSAPSPADSSTTSYPPRSYRIRHGPILKRSNCFYFCFY